MVKGWYAFSFVLHMVLTDFVVPCYVLVHVSMLFCSLRPPLSVGACAGFPGMQGFTLGDLLRINGEALQVMF